MDHRGESLFGHPAWFQKSREVTALTKLRDAPLDSTSAGLPIPVSITVAVIDPVRAAFPMRGTGQAPDFELHQALRGKPYHLRSKSASELFSSSVRRLIISSVILGS